MKKYIQQLTFSLAFGTAAFMMSPSEAVAQTPANEGIEFNVNVYHRNRLLKDAVVYIYNGEGKNAELLKYIDLSDCDNTFTVAPDQYVWIEIASNGYHSKTIRVNSFASGEVVNNVVTMDVELFSTRVTTDPLVYIPVAFVHYDAETMSFDNDATYSSYVAIRYPQLAKY